MNKFKFKSQYDSNKASFQSTRLKAKFSLPSSETQDQKRFQSQPSSRNTVYKIGEASTSIKSKTDPQTKRKQANSVKKSVKA